LWYIFHIGKISGGSAAKIPDFEILGYKRFPVHVEEGLLEMKTVMKADTPWPLSANSSTTARLEELVKTLKIYSGNREAAETELRKSFGNTYWYYSFYR
jgi:Family of unknown function (DUF6057)